MIDGRTQGLLQEIVRRESRSLMQYLSESFPWTNAAERPLLADVQRLMAEDRQGLAALGRFLVRQRVGLPHLGQFPMEFTDANFVALEHVLPKLAEAQRQSVAALERDVAATHDPAAREQVQRLLDLKRRHLDALTKMAAEHSQATATLR